MNNENKSLSNEDFRSLVDKKSHSSNNNSYNNKKKWTNNNNSNKYSGGSGSSGGSSSSGSSGNRNTSNTKSDYIDRAKERRNQVGDSDGSGGIKKGLDFELLHDTKEKLNMDQQQQHQQQHQQPKPQYQSESERIRNIKTKGQLASSITKVLSNINDKSANQFKKNQQEKHNKEIFQISRMIYLFDLDPVFTQLIPTTIMNSKEDCPKVKELISGRLDSSILKRVINFYHPDKEFQSKKSTINQFKDNSSSGSKNISGSGDDIFSDSDDNQSNIKKDNIALERKDDDDDDSGSDIFSDVEDYVCEANNNSKSTATITTTTTATTESIKPHNYFKKEKDDYSDEFKPIGKEGDEIEVDNSGNVSGKEEEGELIIQRQEESQDSEDEYAYPNTDENYEQHEKEKQRLEREQDMHYDIPRPPQDDNQDEEEEEDEYVYPNTDANYNRQEEEEEEEEDNDIQRPPISNDSESEDEYVYPNTDENYEQHEKDYMEEQEKRLMESSEEEDNIISLDTNNEKLKRKLMDTYGDDDIFPQFEGFGRERGEKVNIDEMYKFKKSTSANNKNSQRLDEQRKKQKLNKDMDKINQIMKKKADMEGKKHYDLFKK